MNIIDKFLNLKKNKNINPEPNIIECNHEYEPFGSTTFCPLKKCTKCENLEERCF
jgi:hypothetical protein